jgi:hypothetical protein
VIERTTLRTVIAAMAGTLVGVSLLYLSGLPRIWTGREALQSVVRDLGAVFVGTVAVATLWELWGKRALLDEVLAKVQLAEQIRAAGLVGVTSDFYTLDWGALLSTTRQLDIFFVRGRTWRRVCQTSLVELAAREHSKIRVVLPDPEDDISICSMADLFETTPDELKRQIKEAREFFESLAPRHGSLGGRVNLWLRRGTPNFTFYILDNVAIIALYAHTSKSFGPIANPVPTLVVSREGWIFEFLRNEFDRMVRETDGRTRRLGSE